MKIEYRRDLQHSYLVIHREDKQEKEAYPSKMITENSIPGLLQCEAKRMDNEILYYYDLTSKISLEERWRGGKAEGEEVLTVIFAFLKVLENMEEYLLSADSVYLKLDQIYAAAGMEEIEFCYIPGETRDLEQQFRELLEETLPLLNHENKKAVLDIYSLYHYVVQEGLTAEGLREHMERYRKSKIADSYETLYEEEKIEEETGKEDFEETVRKEQQKHLEQKMHEQALEAFFQDEDPEETKTFSGWIAVSAGAVFVYALIGWLMWRNYRNGILIWLGIGIALAAGWGIFLKVRNKKDILKEDNEIPMLQKDRKEDAYERGWVEDSSYQEEYLTKILGNESVRPVFQLEEKYPRQDRSILIKDKEIQFVGTMKERADIILPSQAVSRLHGRIRIEGNDCYLRDLNSRNGTWINGVTLEGDREEKLEEGDEVRFADLIYRFRK